MSIKLSQTSAVQRYRDKSQNKTPTNPSENFGFQISQAFQYISDAINHRRDNTHIGLTALSADALKGYQELQIVASRLSRCEEIVGNEQSDAKRSLERFQAEIKYKQDLLTPSAKEKFLPEHKPIVWTWCVHPLDSVHPRCLLCPPPWSLTP